MKKILLSTIFLVTFIISSQELDSVNTMDKDFLESLPESVRADVLSEMEAKSDDKKNFKRRPSTEVSKLETIKNWETFQKQQSLANKSERYGLTLFNSMQSSFMPLNEPNFGNNYIIDYGDYINVELYGTEESSYSVEVKRDGTISLEKIGPVTVAGLNFEQATNLIKSKYVDAFIGVEAFITLSEIRDINILVTGYVNFPGMYTLSGNSNILQALNIAGGINENGSLRQITLKRPNEKDRILDLYQTILFGDISNISFLKSIDLKKKIYQEIKGINVKSLKRNKLHSSQKRYSQKFLSKSLNDISIYNHGKTFHQNFIEIFCKKTLYCSTKDVLARFHRVCWLPLYYPETIRNE